MTGLWKRKASPEETPRFLKPEPIKAVFKPMRFKAGEAFFKSHGISPLDFSHCNPRLFSV
jgi:hypothetical protein